MNERDKSMHIYVDADACPVIGIVERIAKSHNIAVTLLCDTNHYLHQTIQKWYMWVPELMRLILS